MNKTTVERVFVAGHRGMVGAAIVRCLKSVATGSSLQLVLRSHDELDLVDSAQVEHGLHGGSTGRWHTGK
jgi:GDP-L-fucose synthase